MKLFKKKKDKKPLTDKQKLERKQKIKKIVKRVLDILVYGFAILMIFGLVLGSCNQKVKSASAYYHSDNGYTSINSVVVSNSTSTLRYYYDYNYRKTFPSWANHFDVFTNNGTSYLITDTPIDIDNVSYDLLGLVYNSSNLTYYWLIESNSYGYAITFATITQNDIVINRSDILTTVFSGQYSYRSYGRSNSSDDNLFRFVSYYFGELGYNRITYDMPINIQNFSYLFVNSQDTDNMIEGGLLIKNDNFGYDDSLSYSQQYIQNVFSGSFRCNGVYYSGIEFRFTSIYGTIQGYKNLYLMPGATQSISSDDEFYKGYYYLDTISYTGTTTSTIVWKAFNTFQIAENGIQNNYVSLWVGDSGYSTSPFRSLYIYYADDSLSGLIHHPFNEYYPQLVNMTFADFINYIGDAYPSGNSGVPQDNTSPFVSVFAWLRSALNGLMPMFGYTLIPGITIGTLIMVPITMSIILFVVGLFKR